MSRTSPRPAVDPLLSAGGSSAPPSLRGTSSLASGPEGSLASGPEGLPSGEGAAADPELLALPTPKRRERTATVVVMAVTALAALGMGSALGGEAIYALSSGRPQEVADLATLAPGPELANQYVRGHGLLGTAGALRYGRPAEGDSFRLAPVAGNPRIWVEIRVPEGFEGPRFVPPATFAGRLVPLRDAGLRHAGLGGAVPEAQLPADAWLLVDGNSPRASRWALALVALLLGFAGWNLLAIAKVLRRVRDDNSAPVL